MKLNNLRMLRKSRKLSQKELAEIMNISQSMISNYERGSSRLDLVTADKFAKFYGVSVDQLISDENISLLPLSDVSLLDLPEHIKDKILLELLDDAKKNKKPK